MAQRQRQKRGTAAQAAVALVKAGEVVIAKDTQELFVGAGAEDVEATAVAAKLKTENLIGVLSVDQLPDAVKTMLGAWTMKGSWSGATGNIVSLVDPMDGFAVASPLPAAAADNNGFLFLVSAKGDFVIDGQSDWDEGDFIVSDGVKWRMIDNFTTSDIDAGVLV